MSPTLAKTHFGTWNEALLSGNPTSVADLYAESFTLIPTLSKKVITDREGLEEYFSFFLSLRPIGSIIEEHVIEIDVYRYLHCGIYRFDLTRGGKQEAVDARFSMLWQKIDGQWRILHHHSSRVPGS